MPATSEITDRILSGREVVKETDDLYYLGNFQWAEFGEKEQYVQLATTVLKDVKKLIDDFFRDWSNRTANYEDLHYYTSQIYDSVMGEFENPALKLAEKQFTEIIAPFLTTKSPESETHWTIEDILKEVNNYVLDVVWRLLNKKPTRLDYLNFLQDATEDDTVSRVNILTLNHDLVLEHFFRERQIVIADGFGEEINDVRYWNASLLNQDQHKVSLLKFHGSVDWFRFEKELGSGPQYSIGKTSAVDREHTVNPFGNPQRLVDGRPLILAGTFNKMMSYTSGIYAHMFCHLHQVLNRCHRMVVCGYSFNDKGINNTIIQWMNQSPENRIFVIHHDFERLIKTSRPAVTRNFENWERLKRVGIIQKRIENVTWAEIKNVIV